MNYQKQDLLSILAVVAGTVPTWYLNNEVLNTKSNAVVASAIVGLVAGFFIKKYAGQIYCGSFVGMCSAMVIESVAYSVVFGIVAGLIFVTWKGYLNGHGGKFGTTAYMAVLAMTIILSLLGKEYNAVFPAAASVITIKWFVLVLATGIIATVLTYYARRELFMRIFADKCSDAVLGSALVGLLAGLVLPAVSSTYGTTLSLVAFSASFAGMTAFPAVFDKASHFASAGVFVAFLYTATVHITPGCGGKLGTIGFTSVILVKYILEHYREIRRNICEA